MDAWEYENADRTEFCYLDAREEEELDEIVDEIIYLLLE